MTEDVIIELMNKLIMMDNKIKTVSDLEKFLGASKDLDFRQTDRNTTYEWINDLLKRFSYLSASKKHKGILKRYLVKMTGYTDRLQEITDVDRMMTLVEARLSGEELGKAVLLLYEALARVEAI